MKAKFWYLVRQSLNKKINTKWFKITNVIILILLIGLANMDRIISYFGGDFSDETILYVEDRVGVYDTFDQMFSYMSSYLGDSKNISVKKSEESTEQFKESLEDNNKILLIIDYDSNEYIRSELISFEELDTITNQLILTTLNNMKTTIVASQLGLTESDMEMLSSPISMSYTYTNEDKETNENRDIIASGLSLVIILPCFFLIVMLVQMIGAEINEEKTSRSMEIIISNVPAKVHFLSKVLSSTTFVLLQGLLVLVYGLIAYVIRIIIGGTSMISNIDLGNSVGGVIQTITESGIIEHFTTGLPFILILFVFSFFLYAIVAGVLASVTTSNEDFQQLQTPIMLIIMVGYYLAIMAVSFEGATFIKFVSYIPMLSFLLAPVLYMLEQITIWELGISTLLCILCTFVAFKYGLRIYKEGILNYSSSKLWRKMLQSVKHK